MQIKDQEQQRGGGGVKPVPPKTMKAAQGKDYGEIDEMLTVQDTVPYPSLTALYPKAKQRKNYMIIRTHAVAVACGDCRVLSGLTRTIQGPPSFPYIPCGDCSGEVVEVPSKEDGEDFPFRVGDRVTARFMNIPRNALAEYAVVHQAVCEKVPEEISSVDAAALAGACPATLLGERIRQGERVLILGAGGGIGSLLCQILRVQQGASYIAGASQQFPDRLLQAPMSYDKIVDYTKEDPFSVKEFQQNPFDVVVDLAGVGGWLSLVKSSQNGVPAIVKPTSQGGRYLTLVPDKAIFETKSLLHVFLFVPLWRFLKSRLWSRSKLPQYTFAFSLDSERSHLTRTLEMAMNGTIKAVVDPRGPFPFTTEGVRKAFRLQETRHAQGKVIIEVSKSP